MYDFLLQTSLFLSLGIIIFMMARAVPRVTESGEVKHAPGFFDRALGKLPLREIDKWLSVFFEKSLRRIKIWLMKSDNLVDKHLNKFKKSDKNGGSAHAKDDLFGKANGDKKE